jgi:hypothetical protein
MERISRLRFLVGDCVSLLLLLMIAAPAAFGQAAPTDTPADGMVLYRALAKFELSGGTAQAENVVLRRDRAEMTFDGTFYFEAPLDGHIRGAVFIGSGKVHADVPNNIAEQDNIHRMLHADAVESTFRTAVLRFSDDTADALGLKIAAGGPAPDEAQKLAAEFSARLLRETGANVPARIVVSMLNRESPGFCAAEFDKGTRGRFGLILDVQGRLPTAHFGLNGGEKGLFFAFDETIARPDVWMAFYSQADHEKRVVEYSDAHALVKIARYDMDVDVREWKHMKLEARMQMTVLTDGVRAIPLMINESLPEYDQVRLKKALRLKGARLASGEALNAIQEDWDGSVTLVLPAALAKGQTFEPILDFEGEYLFGDSQDLVDAHYLRGDSWYPRHIDLERSQFDITFHHKKGTRVASIGQKVREEPGPNNDVVTEWRMDKPVPIATFAVGDFEVFTDKVKMETGGELDLDLYRARTNANNYVSPVKADFILAEMSNSVRYFSALFGPYPYPRFGATYHPFPYGQGFPSMLMLPKADQSDKYTYSFIAHETSHQWWGNIVAWRSYRDQWLSEGFADYSGVLYTGLRDKDRNSPRDLLRLMHDELLESPENLTGLGKGRLADIGPIILGRRLNTRESFGAYEALIYKKGALVLRMLHFLFTDPATGEDKAFFNMMKDFVGRYTNGAASTENFMAVANEHFVNTPIARTYQMKDLGWFFRQWVYESSLPSYDFSYSVEAMPDGTAMVHGTVLQRNAPADWLMPLPLVVHLGKDKVSRGLVVAAGPERAVTIHLPAMPDSIELDPDRWVLAEKTTTTKVPGKK